MGMARCLECEGYGDSKQDVDGSVWNSKGYICSNCCEKKTEEELEQLETR